MSKASAMRLVLAFGIAALTGGSVGGASSRLPVGASTCFLHPSNFLLTRFRREGLSCSAARRGDVQLGPSMKTSKPNLKKTVAQREDDPEERKVVERQKVLTQAMELLQKWDEEQEEYIMETADPNAPLGDWRGLRRQLTTQERVEMRQACKVLCEDAKYVCIGLNAATEDQVLEAFNQFLDGLDLPKPDVLKLTDDAQGEDFESKADMPPDLVAMYEGPCHIGYNSKADADEITGDDSNAPAAAHMMPYPASDRGVVFTPILEGFFTQYGDIPLDLFAPDDEVEARAAAGFVSAASDPDVVLRQHAAIGNKEAIKELARLEAERRLNRAPGEPEGM